MRDTRCGIRDMTPFSGQSDWIGAALVSTRHLEPIPKPRRRTGFRPRPRFWDRGFGSFFRVIYESCRSL